MHSIQTGKISAFEALVERVMEKDKAVGLAVAVVDPAGRTLYERCFGTRDREKKLPVDGDTVFGLASVSKSFIALSIMQLAQEGLVDLRAPLRRYLPEYQNDDVLLEHLLYHSGGYYPQPRETIGEAAEKLGLSLETDGDLAYQPAVAEYGARLIAQTLASQSAHTGRPGQRFSYCNDGFELLGDVVRRFGGEPTVADYLNRRVFAPLGMTRSSAGFVLNGDNVSCLYTKERDELKGGFSFYDNASILVGGGGLKSTLNDMKKYVSLYLRRGQTPSGRLLDSYWIEEMQRPRQTCGLNAFYGYGLEITPASGYTVIHHGGAMVGISSNMSWSHEAGAGVIVLCNTSGVSVAAVARAAREMLWDLTPAGQRWDDGRCQKVCGRYVSDEGVDVSISRKDAGFSVRIGDQELFAEPVNQTTLRIARDFDDMLISVLCDDDGEVRAVFAGLRIIPKVS